MEKALEKICCKQHWRPWVLVEVWRLLSVFYSRVHEYIEFERDACHHM